MEALARRVAAPVFILALFSSAALIFVLQPMFGRMVTPLLGGSPQVWNTSMAFFQAALLVGYLYAHLLARVQDLRIQAGVHALVLLAAWFVLPVQVTSLLGEPSSEHPVWWLIGVLALSVGAPFAAASATAPLLQAWYARTGRADASDPYYLYAASNLGSFAGLLAYPALIEPLLGVQAQGAAWQVGYLLVGALIALAAAMAITSHGETPKPLEHTGPAPSWRERGYWVAAAAVPSALSLGVTLHISTDVASAPMLWVIPLALYLLTFVLAFARGSERMEAGTLFIHPVALALMLMSYYASGNWMGSVSGILAGFFFSALICHLALAHSRPSADRLTEFYLYVSLGGVLGGAFAALVAPLVFNNVYEYPLALAAACLFRPREDSDMPRLVDASLTAAITMGLLAVILLYFQALDSVLIIAAVGAGAAVLAAGWGDESRPAAYRYTFLGVAAVHAILIIYIVFNLSQVFVTAETAEATRIVARQPWGGLLMGTSFFVLAFAVHGTILPRKDDGRVADLAIGVAMASVVLVLLLLIKAGGVDANLLTVAGILFCGVAIFFNRGKPWALAAIVLVAFTIIFFDETRGSRIITQERSFFGVLRTREFTNPERPDLPALRMLMHGTTIHGAQLVGPTVERQALTYYHERTALGQAITVSSAQHAVTHLALIGLGTGSTACLLRPTDQLTIFEIDPAVVRLSAEEGGDFTFVRACQPNRRIELGDARLQIAEEPNGAFDVIVVDAFSSDAIPAHLLTREAIALYLSKLSDRGIVILHLSNRNLALVSEAARVAHSLNVPYLYRISDRFELERVSYVGGLAASVMVIANSPNALAPFTLDPDWRLITPPPGRPWTDDYINLPRALWDGLTGAETCIVYHYLQQCQPTATETDGAPMPAVPPSP
ncbi:MAG: fused MFS/spermidine synthase [Hyphomonadaceae bacterium]